MQLWKFTRKKTKIFTYSFIRWLKHLDIWFVIFILKRKTIQPRALINMTEFAFLLSKHLTHYYLENFSSVRWSLNVFPLRMAWSWIGIQCGLTMNDCSIHNSHPPNNFQHYSDLRSLHDSPLALNTSRIIIPGKF